MTCKVNFWKIFFTAKVLCDQNEVKCKMSRWQNAFRAEQRDHRFLMRFVCRNCSRLHRSSRAWVTSDYVTSVPCHISRLPTALSRCWDNGSIRMDHDPGLDVPGTLEINARVMIPTVLFHRRCRRGNLSLLVYLSVIRIDRVCHCRIPVSQRQYIS